MSEDPFGAPGRTAFNDPRPARPERSSVPGTIVGSWVRRIRALFFGDELRAAERVYDAATDLANAQGRYAEAKGRIKGDGLRKIEDGAALQVDKEFMETQRNSI